MLLPIDSGPYSRCRPHAVHAGFREPMVSSATVNAIGGSEFGCRCVTWLISDASGRVAALARSSGVAATGETLLMASGPPLLPASTSPLDAAGCGVPGPAALCAISAVSVV